ncbi:Rne/Rng family ribonuclease [Schaalia sp. lx-100]|uniref:Rne/Rng family ribonuclease n=1 Tax=Schaalia sp. lx-100 TaxID=2899081 RepID=UPI001E4B1A66|nr:Rne/Rng family ribonuclease [Schaalia sp. lx-100]
MSNDLNLPETPAASLLFRAPEFQAPTFQAAPPVSTYSADEPTRSTRTRQLRKTKNAPSGEEKFSDSEFSDEETTTKNRRRRSVLTSEDLHNDDETTPSYRRRRRRTVSSVNDDERAEKETQRAESDDQSTDAAEEFSAASLQVEDAFDEEVTTTRRRRRRRSHAVADEEIDSTDLTDQVKALKGSTRLEAKKQRRREGRKENRRRHSITESEFLARRESVNRVMVIRHQDGLDQVAVLEDDLLVEHYVARRTHGTMVGNIYLGRVQNVLPSMEAAFVDIGRGRNAVLYAGEVNWDAVGLEGRPRRIESALKSGDPVLVQVTKDPIMHKGARLTSQITLAGRYLVLIPGGSMMGISRKLPEKERQRLKRILKQIVPDNTGVIVRTAAEGATEEQIRDDVSRLTKQWADIESKKNNGKSAPVLLRGEPDLAVRVVRDLFNEDFASLIIQGKETYQRVKEYVEELSPELSERVQLWTSHEDIFAAHRIDEQLSKGMDRKVWLPSGGTLIIDRTEAMTVIDVNTGKFIGAGGTLEETVTRNNLEAAEEIVRQLRLRDIGGIVIIDFVDMVLESNRDLVLRRLVECLGRDRTRHQVTEITSLGLVQMTRKRAGEGLVEAFSTTCQSCEGRGFIVHQHPVEADGSHAGGAKSTRKKKNMAEPRRIEEGPERERAREALSAIAAATSQKDDATFNATEEGTPEPEKTADGLSEAPRSARSRGKRKQLIADMHEAEKATRQLADRETGVESTEEIAQTPVTSKTRRVRHMVTAPVLEPPITQPVSETTQENTQEQSVSDMLQSEEVKEASVTSSSAQGEVRGRAHTTRRGQSHDETSRNHAQQKKTRQAARRTVKKQFTDTDTAVTGASQEKDEVSLGEYAEVVISDLSGSSETVSQRKRSATTSTGRKTSRGSEKSGQVKSTTRRRRSVTAQSIEPETSENPVTLELPPVRTGTSARATVALNDIILPERTQAAQQTKRRRRAVSTGIVSPESTGEA